MRVRCRTLVAIAAILALAASAAAAAGEETTPVAALVGGRLVVAMEGTTPSPSLLARARAGEIGGVILFGGNVRSAPQVRALTAALHGAAEAGGRPRLLVLVDQEGGLVRRVRWAPPAIAAAGLSTRPIRFSEETGRLTGMALRALGIDGDLAPVADVPTAGSFLLAQRRTFGTTPARIALRSAAFARGLRAGGVLAAAKHFPGIGRAHRSTDEQRVTIEGGLSRDDLLPFRVLVEADVPIVMLANAAYAGLDGKPAAWSPAARRLLRRDLGFEGATITDALEPLARTRGVTIEEAATRAAAVGTDLLLVTGSEASSLRVHAALVAAAASGRLRTAALELSSRRLATLRQASGG